MSGYRIAQMSGHDPALKSFEAMIYSDWLRSLRYGNELFRLIDSESYFRTYKMVIKNLLNQPESVIRLAVLSDDPDICLGWSLSEKMKLHYVFMKRDYRNQGIAKNLMPESFNQVTHLTKIGQSIWQNKLKNVIFDPFN